MSYLQEAVTDREHGEFCRDLDDLFEKHKTRFLSAVEVGGWDSTLEALLLGIGAVIRRLERALSSDTQPRATQHDALSALQGLIYAIPDEALAEHPSLAAAVAGAQILIHDQGATRNAEAGAVDAASSVGAHTSSSLSSSLVLSSSSLRTLVERLLELAARFDNLGGAAYTLPEERAMLREAAALLSPVAVDETHEDPDTRTGDDGLSTSSRTASTKGEG